MLHSQVWIGPKGKPRNEEVSISRLKSIELLEKAARKADKKSISKERKLKKKSFI
jgi:hypothetical protein